MFIHRLRSACGNISRMKCVSPIRPEIAVTLLTGGGDKPYAVGLATELAAKGVIVQLVGSDALDCNGLRGKARLEFVNLRGDQKYDVAFSRKLLRVLVYYIKLFRYAAVAKPAIFHILWNNRFQAFDRTLLPFYYKLLGKRIVLTAHDVNQSKMHGKDTFINRVTLRFQYSLADHIFVHTEKAKKELIQDFGSRESKITVIPFGINNCLQITDLTPQQAKERLGLGSNKRTLLFFGRLAPYKGIEHLIVAFRCLSMQTDCYRLVIAGNPDLYEKYWGEILKDLRKDLQAGRILLRAEFIPDEEVEIYFKAADVLVLPYSDVYQSGVLLLAHSFGLPVIASDVGSFREDVVDEKTGFICRPRDRTNLAATIERYFASDLFASLNNRREEIRAWSAKSHCWDSVGKLTLGVYGKLLRFPVHVATSNH